MESPHPPFRRRFYNAETSESQVNVRLRLDKVHRVSISGQNTLRVDLMDFNGAERCAKYESFGVADGSDKYRLNISRYSGSFILLLPFKR